MVCSLCKGSMGHPNHNKRTCPLAKSVSHEPDPIQKEKKLELMKAINLLGKQVTHWDDLGNKNHLISGGRWWLSRGWKDEEDIQVRTKCHHCEKTKHMLDFAKPRSYGGRAGRASASAPYIGLLSQNLPKKSKLCEYCGDPEVYSHLYPCCQRSCCQECREEGPSPIHSCPFCCE